jgi:hypothetical protein
MASSRSLDPLSCHCGSQYRWLAPGPLGGAALAWASRAGRNFPGLRGVTYAAADVV